MPRTLIDLNPDKTVRLPSVHGHGKVIWTAVSADGLWTFEREEDTGSTWTATYVRTGDYVIKLPSLPFCRESAADGWLLREIAQQKADAAHRATLEAELAAGPPRCTLVSSILFAGPHHRCPNPPADGDRLGRCSEHPAMSRVVAGVLR